MEPDDVLTPKDAARILRLNLETVRRLLREGLLPGRNVGLRQWRIRRVDLDEYLSSVPGDGQSDKDRTDGHGRASGRRRIRRVRADSGRLRPRADGRGPVPRVTPQSGAH